MANKSVLDAKQKHIVTALRLVFVTIGAVVMLVGVFGMLGYLVSDSPILNQLGFFIILILGAAMVFTGLFKTSFFIEFVVSLL